MISARALTKRYGDFTAGMIQPSIWGHLAYFGVMIVLGIILVTDRLEALFLR